MQLGVILAHGIGNQGQEWDEEIIQSLEAAVLHQLAELLPGNAPLDIHDVLHIGRFHWAQVLEEHQRELRRILSAAHTASAEVVTGGFLKALGTRVRQEVRGWQELVITDFVGDVIGYMDSGARVAIAAELSATLERLAARDGAARGKLPVTFIAHSLGTVISSDYVWDQTQARRRRRRRGFHDRLAFANFFTIGSPLALFSLRYGGPEAFNKPVTVESSRGRWVNIYDDDDPVGMPLKPLNAAYGRAVWKDARVESGPYLFAHAGYFSTPGTLAIISRKLALDWLALNRRLPSARQAALDAAYDSTLGL